MRGLLLLDLYMIRRMASRLFLILVVLYAASVFKPEFTGFASLMLALYTLTAIISIANSGIQRASYYLATPVGRKDYINEKYLVTGILLLACPLLGAAFHGVQAVLGQGDTAAIGLEITILASCICAISQGVMLPFILCSKKESAAQINSFVSIAAYLLFFFLFFLQYEAFSASRFYSYAIPLMVALALAAMLGFYPLALKKIYRTEF